MKKKFFILLNIIILLIYANCIDRKLGQTEPITYTAATGNIVQIGSTSIDILFVVDNSNSMRGEQIALAQNFPVLINELLNPSGDTPAVEDMHMAVVTVNLGVGGNPIQNCDGNGDDGIMISAPRCEGEDCPTNCGDVSLDTPFMQYPASSGDDVSHQFQCIAQLGTGGCGFEQQLESAYRALTIQSIAGGPNNGFLRDTALLAIIFVTDEDDCSASDSSLFDPNRTDLGTNLQTRCFIKQNEGLLYTIERYYQGFSELKLDINNEPDKNRLVIAGIVGLTDDYEQTLVDGMISDTTIERLQSIKEQIVDDPNNPNQQRVKWACESELEPSSAFRYADAAVRFAELVKMFQDNGYTGILHSICESDWQATMEAITDRIQSKLTGKCMVRQVSQNEGCNVTVVLPSGETCNGTFQEFDSEVEYGGETRQRCIITGAEWSDTNGNYVVDNSETVSREGWYYVPKEYSSSECQSQEGEVRFTNAAVPIAGSLTQISCPTFVCPQRRECADPNAENGCCPEGYYCVNNSTCVDDPRSDN